MFERGPNSSTDPPPENMSPPAGMRARCCATAAIMFRDTLWAMALACRVIHSLEGVSSPMRRGTLSTHSLSLTKLPSSATLLKSTSTGTSVVAARTFCSSTGPEAKWDVFSIRVSSSRLRVHTPIFRRSQSFWHTLSGSEKSQDPSPSTEPAYRPGSQDEPSTPGYGPIHAATTTLTPGCLGRLTGTMVMAPASSLPCTHRSSVSTRRVGLILNIFAGRGRARGCLYTHMDTKKGDTPRGWVQKARAGVHKPLQNTHSLVFIGSIKAGKSA